MTGGTFLMRWSRISLQLTGRPGIYFLTAPLFLGACWDWACSVLAGPSTLSFRETRVPAKHPFPCISIPLHSDFMCRLSALRDAKRQGCTRGKTLQLGTESISSSKQTFESIQPTFAPGFAPLLKAQSKKGRRHWPLGARCKHLHLVSCKEHHAPAMLTKKALFGFKKKKKNHSNMPDTALHLATLANI